MACNQPYLELRATGYYWRRRVPSRESNRFIPAFFCFPLQTHVIREAAGLARRLTAISDLCFAAEPDVSPEVMTQILTDYARLEIETADRLRALTGPRTREAAEAALAIEAAARASLRDAIFLCERSAALPPIHDTAARMGVSIDEDEEDFAILADRMIRLMIEVSDEKERRARGIYQETQPYLSMALRADPPAQVPQAAAPCPATTRTTTEPSLPTVSTAPEPDAPAQAETGPVKTLFHDGDSVKISVTTGSSIPARGTDGSDPGLLQLWDSWFDESMRGVTVSRAYTFEDTGKAARFKAESDTINSTRKLLFDVFGEKRMSEIRDVDWTRYNDMLRALPNNQGRSSKLRHLTCFEFTARSEEREKRNIRAAQLRIKKERLEGDEKEKVLREAKFTRISPRTFQRHQKYLSAPLDHAVERGRLSHNPFKPFVLGEAAIDELRKGLADTSRLLWTSTNLSSLLSTEKWRSQKTQIDDEVYWVPLIARLHGLRSEEILQLKPSNIGCDDGIHFFEIERGTGQSIKSDNAKRLVPIHSQLIELGFLDFVERQRTLKKQRIFAKATRSKSKKLSFTANFTKNFNYYRTSREVYDKRRDLHGMRTTFNTKMVGRSVPDTARRYLMGHKNEDVGIINYLPEGFPLATLRDYIEQEHLDLSMVTRRFASTPKAPKRPRLVSQDGISLSA